MLNVEKTTNCDDHLIFISKVYIMCGNKHLKNCSNLINWVIIGPLWVKYGPKTACQPPAAQTPGHAPD